MDNATLSLTIDTLYDIRKELRKLQDKARLYNEQIIDALEANNGEIVTDNGIKAYLSTRMITKFDTKAAKLDDAAFVAKYTTLKAVTVLNLA